MYTLEKTFFGYDMSFSGEVTVDEIQAWFDESRTYLKAGSHNFGVIADMRELQLMNPGARDLMRDAQAEYKAAGMARSAVILSTPEVTAQFRAMGQESGICDWERYLDASQDPNWRQAALNWIMHNIDPDQ